MALSGCNKAKSADLTDTTEITSAATESTPGAGPLEIETTSETTSVKNVSLAFNPHAYSSILYDVYGDEYRDSFFNLCDALMEGKDTFECANEEVYNWCMNGVTLNQLYPVACCQITSEGNDGDPSYENGTGHIYYKKSVGEFLQRQNSFIEQVEEIKNDYIKPDYSDFEICLALYDYIASNYTYDHDGTLDRMVPNQDYSDRQIIMDDPRLRYYEAPQACTFLVAFNNARGPFADKRVREAVARAIDKEELILGAVNGMADPTDGGIVPMCPQAPKDFKGLAYDPEMSKKLLAEAGYANGLNVTMRVIGATNYTKPAEVLQAQLKKVGINMKIEAMDRGRWFDLVLNKAQFDITFYAHAISVNDADFCTYPFLHSSQLNGKGTNYMGVNIPEMDACLDKARSALDNETRNANYARVCEIVRDESIYVPCYTGKRTVAAVAGLKGVFADPMQRYYVYNYEW